MGVYRGLNFREYIADCFNLRGAYNKEKMEQLKGIGPGRKTTLYLDTSLAELARIAPPHHSILVVDEQVLSYHAAALEAWPKILLPSGEAAKSLSVLEQAVAQLTSLEAGRDCTLVGIGGGVVSDFTGFLAGVYKRGVHCGFVPTTVLAMVDAAVGGKNGLNAGTLKNMIGLTRQPDFLLYDYALLQTLPPAEWVNGFAEIIKHAVILDRELFESLESRSTETYRSDQAQLAALVKRNVLLKYRVVEADEFESGMRKLLNFGHTFGHAFEKLFALPHGHAVSVGMVWAAKLAQQETGFAELKRLQQLLLQYGLPVALEAIPEMEAVLTLIANDKKRQGATVDFVLPESIGRAVIRPMPLEMLRKEVCGS